MKKIFKISFVLSSIALLASCNLEANPDSTSLMTAINYEAPTRIIYSEDKAYETPGYDKAGISPRRINKGDYKPVWSAIQNRLHINLLEHQAAANSGSKKACDYFRDNWMIKPYADLSMGTVYDINNYSVAGSRETILDLKPYIEETQFIRGEDPKHPGEETDIVDPAHPGSLPNIALFLHQNPGVLLSITTAKHSRPDQAAIYYVPYFDGFADLEKGTIMRADYVQRLLDDDLSELDNETKNILGKSGSAKYTKHYEPCYEDASHNAPEYVITIPAKDDNGEWTTTKITKKSTENIITLQDKLIDKGEATSRALAQQFRDYINERYPANTFEKNSDLFLGYNACYDADELVALMRLVKVSPGSFFKNYDSKAEHPKEMVTMMPRLCDNQRASDLYRWAGQMFGVRGLESRNGYLYIGGEKSYPQFGDIKYGAVHDARGTDNMLYALKKMNSLYQEGLILQNFDDMTATGSPNGKFADESLYSGGSDAYAGFMLYDYPKDLNDWNRYESSEKNKDKPCVWVTPDSKTKEQGGHPYSLRTVVSPVANWDIDNDGTRDTWMQFTESWASVKTSALCLNADLVKNDVKREAAFKLIDYAYSDEGMFLLNYGPWEDGYITEKAGDYTNGKLGVYSEDAEKDVDYIEYQGERFPCLTPKAKEQHNTISSLQRMYVGATLPFGFKKLNAVSYQTYDENTTKVGIDIVNKAIELGTNKHVLVGGDTEQQKRDYKTPFYQITPSAFFLTKGQSSAISTLLDKNALGSMFTDSGSSNFNIWDALVMGKETRLGVTLNNYLDTVRNSWKVGKLESYYQDAFEIMTLPIEYQ